MNPPPPLPQLSADLGLNPNPELRRKRHQKVLEEGEIGLPKENKQQRQSQDQRSRRSNSVDSREDPPMAQMHRPSCIWSPKLEVDGVPIALDSSIRHYHGGHAGHVVETLEQPLFLPKDMEAYRHFSQQKLFLSLKRDLAMVSGLIYYPI